MTDEELLETIRANLPIVGIRRHRIWESALALRDIIKESFDREYYLSVEYVKLQRRTDQLEQALTLAKARLEMWADDFDGPNASSEAHLLLTDIRNLEDAAPGCAATPITQGGPSGAFSEGNDEAPGVAVSSRQVQVGWRDKKSGKLFNLDEVEPIYSNLTTYSTPKRVWPPEEDQ